MDEVDTVHLALKIKLSNLIDIESSEYENLCKQVEAIIGRGLAKRKKTPQEKFDALETKGSLKPGSYDLLREIFWDSGNEGFLEYIDEADAKIRDIRARRGTIAGVTGGNVVYQREQPPQHRPADRYPVQAFGSLSAFNQDQIISPQEAPSSPQGPRSHSDSEASPRPTPIPPEHKELQSGKTEISLNKELELRVLNTELRNLVNMVDTLETKVQDTRIDVTSYTGELDEIKTEHKQLNTELTHVKSQAYVFNQFIAYNQIKGVSTEKLSEVRNRIGLLETQIQAQSKELTDRMEKLETQCKTLTQEQGSHKRKLDQLETDVNEEQGSQRKKLEKLETGHSAISKEQGSQRQKLDELETNVNKEQGCTRQRLDELETGHLAVNQEQGSQRQRLDKLETGHSAISKEQGSQRQRLDELETGHLAVNQEQGSQRQRLDNLEMRIEQTMEESFKELEAPPPSTAGSTPSSANSSSWANSLAGLAPPSQPQSQPVFSMGGSPFPPPNNQAFPPSNQAFPPAAAQNQPFGAPAQQPGTFGAPNQQPGFGGGFPQQPGAQPAGASPFGGPFQSFEDRDIDAETHIDGEFPPNAVVIANTNVINGDDEHLSVYRGQVIFLKENQLKGWKEEMKAETYDSSGVININSISELEMSCLRTAPNIITDDLLPHCLSGTFFIHLEENTAHFVYNKVGTVYHEKLDLSGLSSDLEILGRVQSFILKNRSIFLFYIDDDSATYCNQFLNSNRHINKDGKLSPYIPDWYHGYAGEDHAKKVLADKQIGSFVVVKGRTLESYILLVTDGTLIHSIPIVEKGGHVAICNKSKQYDSVTDLVEHCFVTPLSIETDDKPAEIFLQRGVSRHEKDIPDGFSTLDPYWTELYMQTLSEGKEKQTSIRLMVVGHEKIGKTTLSRNLMDKTGEEITSTDGIEVHIETCTIGDCGMWKKTDTSNEDSEMYERIGKMMKSNTKSKQDSNTSATANKNQRKHKQTQDLDEMEAVRKKTKYETDSNIQAETRAGNSNGKTSDDMASRQTKEHQTVDDSTRETEIVLPIGNANKIIAHSKSIGNSADKTVSIWDFGGQYIYYATHQLFHSPRAVYLLVLDLSKDLDERVEVENPVGNIRESARDVQSFIKFWMHSIHAFVGSKSGEPPVILVGTHKDKIEGLGKSSKEYSKTYFENVRKLFDDTPLLLKHIHDKQFFLNNLTTDTIALDKLRATIMKIAERQSCFNQEYPARWVQLEYALKKDKRSHLTFSEVCKIDSESEVPIAEIDKIRLFLMFHHFQGNLVYFNENELKDFVILKPQWLIDAFKSIITSGKFCKRLNLRILWKEYKKTGILKKELIKEVWNLNENHEFSKDRDMILKFFVRLGIISTCRSYDDGSGDDDDDDDDGGGDDGDGHDGDDLYNYIVPSLLPVMQTENTMKEIIEQAMSTDLNLVFRFESSYISPTIYHRTTAAAMGRWAVVVNCGKRILYGNIGMYRLDVQHVGLTRLTDATIELSVHNINGKPVKGKVADCFRRFIAKVIKHELNRVNPENISQFESVFRCACTSEDRFEYMTIQELKSSERMPCLQSSPIHHIDGRNSFRQWYPDNVTLSKGNGGTIIDKTLDDRDIGELAKAVGKGWDILGASLGLSLPALDIIEMDHSSSALMQIWHMLKEWKKKAGSSATMETLVDKMKANESSVTIDWDIVQDVLDRCESDDQKLN